MNNVMLNKVNEIVRKMNEKLINKDNVILDADLWTYNASKLLLSIVSDGENVIVKYLGLNIWDSKREYFKSINSIELEIENNINTLLSILKKVEIYRK